MAFWGVHFMISAAAISLCLPRMSWSGKPQNATGCKSNWRVKRCLGFELHVGCRQCVHVCVCRHTCSCKSRRVCLQTRVSFGCSSNVWGSWANGRTPLSHLVPPHPAIAWEWGSSSLEPGGRSNSVIKKHSTRPLVYDSLERAAGNGPATPSKPIPLQLSDL